MSTEKQLYVILGFSLILRAAISTVAPHIFANSTSFAEGIAQSLMYITLLTCTIYQLKIGKLAYWRILGVSPKPKSLMFSVALGIALLAFTLGMNAVEALAYSNLNNEAAYQLWHFHPYPFAEPSLFSYHVIYGIFSGVVFAPFAEEFFFRGVLFPVSGKSNFWKGCLVSGTIFSLLHFSGFYYVSLIVFSVTQCFIYVITRSLYLCVIIHATYNLESFVFENYFDFHFVRQADQLNHLRDWIPQLAMFALSTLILVSLFWRNIKYKILMSDLSNLQKD